MSTDSIPRLPRRNRKEDDPRTIGLWKVGRIIGKGASARVRLARHMKTHQKAAVKIVSKTSLTGSTNNLSVAGLRGERVLLAVEREIVIMKLIDHPNIMRLYDVWETSTHLYLILEYVEGGELFDYLCEKVRLTTSEALGYFQQIIAAMDYCHRFHIAHRDLKPENLLLDADRNIKVADFGMAAWQTSNVLLETSCGSPHYAAPEVVMGSHYDGSTADVWSCGIILFAMLSGRLPFDDEDLETLLNKVREAVFEMPEDIDPQAQDLLRKILTKDPAKRITIAEIFKHPFFLSQPFKQVDGAVPNLDDISKPIPPVSSIDPDIFANLRALWQDISDEEIEESLRSERQSWQKGIYHLLCEYRAKKVEDYDEDEEKVLESLRERRRRRQEAKAAKAAKAKAKAKSKAESVVDGAEQLPPRAAPPTPRRAAKIDSRPSEESVIAPPQAYLPPMITLSSPSPSDAAVNQMPLDTNTLRPPSPAMSAPSSPLLPPSPISPASPLSPIWDTISQIPRDNPVIEEYITRIIEHMNTPQMQGLAQSEMNGRQVTYGEEYQPTVGILASSHVNGIVEVDRNEGRRYHDKENVGNSVKALKIDTSKRTKKSSLRNRDGQQRVALSDRRVQIVEPERQPSKIRKKHSLRRAFALGSPTPSSETQHSPSLPIPSSFKRTWLNTVFNFRPSKHTLNSTRDVYDTRNECRRVLMNLGAKVVLMQAEGPGVLKCCMDEAPFRGVRFRVDVQLVEEELKRETGCGVRLVFVHEKGQQGRFKQVVAAVREDWSFDADANAKGGNTIGDMVGGFLGDVGEGVLDGVKERMVDGLIDGIFEVGHRAGSALGLDQAGDE